MSERTSVEINTHRLRVLGGLADKVIAVECCDPSNSLAANAGGYVEDVGRLVHGLHRAVGSNERESVREGTAGTATQTYSSID